MPLLLTVKTDSSCQLLVVMQSHVGNSKTDNYRLSCTWLGHVRVASGRMGVLGQAVGQLQPVVAKEAKAWPLMSALAEQVSGGDKACAQNHTPPNTVKGTLVVSA